ncbi:uncharacterized protein J3D65DRAFT_660268 [Phyllosticta citribraziliensis]|uniref:Caspase domain-containing protein n=1 Tax=Phyllosticta citribraziliensis TaxID=989973 RepID=A0ABR1LF45_9PEZI
MSYQGSQTHSTKSSAHTEERGHVSGAELLKDIERAVNKAIPANSTPFKKVAVLAVRWDNDLTGCEDAEENLLQVLRSTYGFHCESLVLPSDTAPHCLGVLQEKLFTFRAEWDSDESLMILVYSGHAAISPDYTDMVWCGRADERLGYRGLGWPQISWRSIQGLVEPVKGGRYLFLFDCCAAIAAGFDNGPEFFGASGFHRLDMVSSSSYNFNFTNILARQLEKLDGKPRSISQIYSDMVRSRIETGLQRTPVHLLQQGMDSIVLGRLSRRTQKHLNLTDGDRAKGIETMNQSDHKVMISVNLSGPTALPDAESWKQWLTTNLPPDLRYLSIRLATAKEADSIILLLTMPLEVWDCLPTDKTAYSFVSFVKDSM